MRVTAVEATPFRIPFTEKKIWARGAREAATCVPVAKVSRRKLPGSARPARLPACATAFDGSCPCGGVTSGNPSGRAVITVLGWWVGPLGGSST